LYPPPRALHSFPTRRSSDLGEPERRLVEQEQAWAQHERARDGQHLLFAAGERARDLPPSLAQDREVLVDALEVVAPRALPPRVGAEAQVLLHRQADEGAAALGHVGDAGPRSEEHTSELQSRSDLVCRLLLEKK